MARNILFLSLSFSAFPIDFSRMRLIGDCYRLQCSQHTPAFFRCRKLQLFPLRFGSQLIIGNRQGAVKSKPDAMPGGMNG